MIDGYVAHNCFPKTDTKKHADGGLHDEYNLKIGFESDIDLRSRLNCNYYAVENQRAYKQPRCPSLRFIESGVTQYLRPARRLFYSQVYPS